MTSTINVDRKALQEQIEAINVMKQQLALSDSVTNSLQILLNQTEEELTVQKKVNEALTDIHSGAEDANYSHDNGSMIPAAWMKHMVSQGYTTVTIDGVVRAIASKAQAGRQFNKLAIEIGLQTSDGNGGFEPSEDVKKQLIACKREVAGKINWYWGRKIEQIILPYFGKEPIEKKTPCMTKKPKAASTKIEIKEGDEIDFCDMPNLFVHSVENGVATVEFFDSKIDAFKVSVNNLMHMISGRRRYFVCQGVEFINFSQDAQNYILVRVVDKTSTACPRTTIDNGIAAGSVTKLNK